MTASPAKRWRILRRCLVGLAVLLTLVATFYTEESWRGKRAWEHCKREMEAKGIKMDWADHIPAPVPDDQNVFAVPEMQKLFLGKGATEFSERISDVYEAGQSNRTPTRMVVADFVIGPPEAMPPSGFTALSYRDPQAMSEVNRMIKEAVGPYFLDPYEHVHTLRRSEEIQPAKILLQCQTAPTPKELEQFLSIFSEWSVPLSESEKEEEAKIEPTGNGSYKVTVSAPSTVAEYLAWSAPLEPDFDVIRKALQRPYIRMAGDSQNADAEPPFRLFSPLARTLCGRAQCHLLQGQPEEALRDLTLTRDLCRILESNSRSNWDLLATLVHLTVTAISTSAIADGLARHAWREPQLAALQEQLKEINFLPDLRQVFLAGPSRVSHYYENITPSRLGDKLLWRPIDDTNAWTTLKSSLVGNLIPRGWVYQNIVQLANGYQTLSESTDSSGQLVFPKKVAAATNSAGSHPTPYNFIVIKSMPNFGKDFFNTAKLQTHVNEALIACALERYRLAHNSYPETLDALVPQFLDKMPADIIGGQPLHYHRAEDGKFLLYSIGWNEKDDGGKPGSEDDWVWDNTLR